MKASNTKPVNFSAMGNTDFEVTSLDNSAEAANLRESQWWHYIKYLLLGICFGVILIKSEVVSWYRIQEMFRFQSFHMYGVICSAIVVGMVSIALIKKYDVKTFHGESIKFYPKKFSKGNIYGGLIFGFGWALTGACPGPIFALIGAGAMGMIITFMSALAGTWVYGLLRDKLPH